jgi:hypothetical protein
MALTKVTFSMIDGPTINVKDYGITPSASASDNLTKLNALIASAPVGATLLFPPGTYNISEYVSVLRSNIRLLGGPGVIINNTNMAAGYPSDGIRVGNMAAVEGEGGTNTIPYVYTTNVIVDGFTFTNCRIGLWFVYCRNFLAQNIQANSTAAVACGNDQYDDCDNFELRNITQISWAQRKGSEDFFIVGIFRCLHFTIDGVYQLSGMTTPPGAAAISINSSEYWSLSNAHINQFTRAVDGITIAGCQQFSVSGCTVVNAKNGIVTFPIFGITDLIGTISNCSVVSCDKGVQVYTSYTSFQDIYTSNCTFDLALQTNATLNYFQDCKFNPTGAASIFQEIPTGNNGINLQRWRNCQGAVMGTANGFFEGLSTSFRFVKSTGVTNVTGDGTTYIVDGWTQDYQNTAGTPIFDAATGIFTAPITGLYRFEVAIQLDIDTSGFNFAQLQLLADGIVDDPVLDRSYGSTSAFLNGAVTVKMNRGATASLQLLASGGSKAADIPSNASLNYWSGMLIA